MLEQLWKGFLDLTAQFVLPDWGVVIGMLPVVSVCLPGRNVSPNSPR